MCVIRSFVYCFQKLPCFFHCMDLLSPSDWKSLEDSFLEDIQREQTTQPPVEPLKTSTPSSNQHLPLPPPAKHLQPNYCPGCGRSSIPLLPVTDENLHQSFLQHFPPTSVRHKYSRQKIFNRILVCPVSIFVFLF